MKIIYWSGTGNTEAMANLIGKGIANQGKEAGVLSVDKVSVNEIKNEDTLVLGCPSMGDEALEESEFEPFIESLKSIGNGKKALLFTRKEITTVYDDVVFGPRNYKLDEEEVDYNNYYH